MDLLQTFEPAKLDDMSNYEKIKLVTALEDI